MDEFELIDRLVAILGDDARGPHVVLGPGDDAALIENPANCLAVASIDTLVAGVHFPPTAPADLIGIRALGVSISDLAAMGAEPGYVMIALTLPDDSAQWVEAFARGVAEAAHRYGVKVVGGNIARGPLNVTVSVHGWIERDAALTRAGARAGDLVCVSGKLGGAASALNRPDLATPPPLAALSSLAESDPRHSLRRYYLPEPRIALGRALRGLASAAIDISDGLVADLGHLCDASGVGARIDLDAVPAADGCTKALAATGGDDYELCFTIAARDRRRLDALPSAVVVVGEMRAGTGVEIVESGRVVTLPSGGFRHFR
ncbi:MAG TPA: thiamine-phosphate kinase [Pseudomonadales bacterium]|nr:thiamine-phosphate kinase [Pseudomonadales bacterium]